MNTISAKLTQIKINGENPRSITNDKLNKLVNSILVFPKMLSIRPIVVDDKMVALGGNMRLNALKIIVKMSPEELGARLATIPDYLKKSAGERENIARHWEAWLKSPVVEIIKASELTEDERYMSLIEGQKNWNFKFSIITLDEAKAKRIEKGVPTPEQRLEAIRRIAEAGAGGATLRLRPFIIGISTPTYLDLITEAHKRGATAMSTEFFCVEQRSPTLKAFMPEINELAGFDVMEFYKKYSVSTGYLRLNRKVKEPFMRNMKAKCDELGMRFYVSDAHFKELCCNGSCCGLPADWNYSKGQWCEALQIAKNNPEGIVTWNDVKGDINMLVSQFEWRQASDYNCNSSEKRAKFEGMTMADYMRWLWNNPQNGQSPYKLFEGALVPIDKDLEGNLIYKFNGARF